MDDMLHLLSDPRLMREFLTKYNQEFKKTGGMDKVTDAFVGLELIQGEDGIRMPTSESFSRTSSAPLASCSV